MRWLIAIVLLSTLVLAGAYTDLNASSALFSDLNGDDWEDLILGFPDEQRILIFYAPQTGLLEGAQEIKEPVVGYGNSLATGDFNGDGVNDLMVGSLSDTEESGAFIYYGGDVDQIADVTFWGTRLRGDVAMTDFNADRLADAIVSNKQNAYVYLGGQRGSLKVPDVVLKGPVGNVTTVGDFNNDGLGDVVTNAIRFNNNGAIHIYYGTVREEPKNFDVEIIGTASFPAGFGEALASGDYNDDGWIDLLVGAPGDIYGEGTGTTAEGKAYLFRGPLKSISDERAFAVIDGKETAGILGYEVAFRDWDGDGRDDILVGSYNKSMLYSRRDRFRSEPNVTFNRDGPVAYGIFTGGGVDAFAGSRLYPGGCGLATPKKNYVYPLGGEIKIRLRHYNPSDTYVFSFYQNEELVHVQRPYSSTTWVQKDFEPGNLTLEVSSYFQRCKQYVNISVVDELDCWVSDNSLIRYKDTMKTTVPVRSVLCEHFSDDFEGIVKKVPIGRNTDVPEGVEAEWVLLSNTPFTENTNENTTVILQGMIQGKEYLSSDMYEDIVGTNLIAEGKGIRSRIGMIEEGRIVGVMNITYDAADGSSKILTARASHLKDVEIANLVRQAVKESGPLYCINLGAHWNSSSVENDPDMVWAERQSLEEFHCIENGKCKPTCDNRDIAAELAYQYLSEHVVDEKLYVSSNVTLSVYPEAGKAQIKREVNPLSLQRVVNGFWNLLTGWAFKQ